MGCTEPGKSKHVVLFSVFQFVGKNLEDTLEEAARDWLETATVSNELVVVCQEIFLGLWHAHRNGFYNRDIKPQNMGQDPEGKVVFWDMGHGRCDCFAHCLNDICGDALANSVSEGSRRFTATLDRLQAVGGCRRS